MKKTILIRDYVVFVKCLAIMTGCVKDGNFNPPDPLCNQDIEATITLTDLVAQYNSETTQIQDDWIAAGYVISSDKAGNFFSTLHFQDSPATPSRGLQVDIELRDSHLFYEIGKKIYIRLRGLYLGKSKGVYKLGGAFPSFGNLGVGRLPASMVEEHLFPACEPPVTLLPQQATLSTLGDFGVNTLIQLADVEVVPEELGLPYALAGEVSERTLQDCEGQQVLIRNSGFSDFHSQLLPEGNGTVTAVLYRENTTYQLLLRDPGDLDLSGGRCTGTGSGGTSDAVFISELADPDNESGARFVELYNAGDTPIELGGWTLRRYTNGNTEIGSVLDLSGISIESRSAIAIAADPLVFETVYGFAPQLGAGANSPADSNGDDNLELVDSHGMVMDTFGIIGEDGSGTNHEFEDGRALRNPEIRKANPVYTFSEWVIFNDTGAAGTINLPQTAPGDFTPGIR